MWCEFLLIGFSGPVEPVDMNGELAQLVKKMISDDKVVIFSKTYCPYCTMAKEVIDINISENVLCFSDKLINGFVFVGVQQN